MMIDIRDSVLKEIREKFPNYKIYDEKVLQGLKRPCFFVDLIPVNIERLSPTLKEYSLFVDVQYMSEKETKEEMLIMVDQFETMFNSISFGNLIVQTSNKRFEIVDDILHCLFDLDFTVIGEEIEEAEKIGDLVFNSKVKEGGNVE